MQITGIYFPRVPDQQRPVPTVLTGTGLSVSVDLDSSIRQYQSSPRPGPVSAVSGGVSCMMNFHGPPGILSRSNSFFLPSSAASSLC